MLKENYTDCTEFLRALQWKINSHATSIFLIYFSFILLKKERKQEWKSNFSFVAFGWIVAIFTILVR